MALISIVRCFTIQLTSSYVLVFLQLLKAWPNAWPKLKLD